MRILITGGAGCLGSNLIEHWLPQGHKIFVIDNFATGKREVVPETSGLTVKEGSIADPVFVENCFDTFKPQIVVHSAASYKDPNDWLEDSRTNVIGSIHISSSAKKHDVNLLVNFQTALCYGHPKQLPIPVTHPLSPFTSYGISKTAGEQYLLKSDVPTISLRIANVIGPRLAIGPIPTFYKRLKAGQSCYCSDTSRDFLDMSDFLSFMDLAIGENAPTGIFNISSGEAHSMKEIFTLVAGHLGVEPQEVPIIPPAKDDISAVSLDPSETYSSFGWKAQVGFEKSVQRQLAWYDAYGVTDVFSHLKPASESSRK